MARSILLAGLTLASIGLGGVGGVRAQDEDPGEAEARAVFERAQAYFDEGRFELAAEGFQRSYEIMRGLGRPTAVLILFNVGSALQRVPGRERDARDAYQRFLEEASPDDPVQREQIRTVQERIAEIDARLRASPSPPSEVAGGEGGASIHPAGPILLGAGGAMVAAGLTLGALALGRDAEVGSACPTRAGCPSSLRGQYDEARTLAQVGDALWISGALVAATGLVLTLVLDGGGAEGGPEASVGCDASGCRAVLRGAF